MKYCWLAFSIILSINTAVAKNIDLVSLKIVAENHILLKGNSQLISNSEVFYDDNNKNELFCLFELAPKGYIVVTTNTELPPVVAYSFLNNIDKAGKFIEILKYDIGLRMSNLAQTPEAIKQKNNNKWNNLLSEKPVKDKNQVWPLPGTTTTGGWLQTNWSQNSPYKDMCPMDPVDSVRCVAGCPAVAMGMIVNYHKTTNNVFFDDSDDYYHNYAGRQYWIDDDYIAIDFLSFPELNTYLDILKSHYQNNVSITNNDMSSLVFACAVACKQVFTSGISGTFGVSQALDAYYKFNFNNIDILYSGNTTIQSRLIANIIDSLPAHLALVDSNQTIWHNVVVDGYDTDGFFHLNFGWGGTSNGWYFLPAGIPYNLTVIEGIILDIKINN